MSAIRILLEICLLQRGPQDLAPSAVLMVSAVAAYVAVGVMAQAAAAPDTPPLPPVVVNVAIVVGLTGAMLSARGLMARFRQTISALAGTGTLLTLAGMPVLQGMLLGEESPTAMTISLLGWLGLVVWSFVVTAHILRHALSVSFSTGVLYAMFFLAASIAAYSILTGLRA